MKRLVFLILTGIVIFTWGCEPQCGDPIHWWFNDYCKDIYGLCPYKGDTSLILSGQIDTTKIVVYDQDGDTLQHQIIQDCIRIKMDTGSVACDKFNAMNKSVNDTMIDYLIVIDYGASNFSNDTFVMNFNMVRTNGECFGDHSFVNFEFYHKIDDTLKRVGDFSMFWPFMDTIKYYK